MKTILLGTYYQTLTFFRVKKAVFFSFFFPSFMFIIFSLTWGWENIEYNIFLLSGIIAVTTVSDSLFSVGNVIVEYYHNGLIKFYRCIPYKFIYHLISLFISRLLIVFTSVAVVIIVAKLSSNIPISWITINSYVQSIIVGLIVFSMVGIIVAMLTKDYTGNSTAQNIILFTIIFLSNTFYPLSDINPIFSDIILFNPITPILQIARNEHVYYLTIIIWLIILTPLIVLYFNKQQIKR